MKMKMKKISTILTHTLSTTITTTTPSLSSSLSLSSLRFNTSQQHSLSFHTPHFFSRFFSTSYTKKYAPKIKYPRQPRKQRDNDDDEDDEGKSFNMVRTSDFPFLKQVTPAYTNILESLDQIAFDSKIEMDPQDLFLKPFCFNFIDQHDAEEVEIRHQYPLLRISGSKALPLVLSRYLCETYNNLPGLAIKYAYFWFNNDNSLAKFANFLGLQSLIKVYQTKNENQLLEFSKLTIKEKVFVMANSVRAFIGAVHLGLGSEGTKILVQHQIEWANKLEKKNFDPLRIASKSNRYFTKDTFRLYTDTESSLPSWIDFSLTNYKGTNWRLVTSEVFSKLGWGKPTYSLLRQIGHQTNNPIFVCAIFDQKGNARGKGIASSIVKAEFSAAKNAIDSFYVKLENKKE